MIPETTDIQKGNILIREWEELLERIYRFISYYPKLVLSSILVILGTITSLLIFFYPLYTSNTYGISDETLLLITLILTILSFIITGATTGKIARIFIDLIFTHINTLFSGILENFNAVLGCLQKGGNPIDSLDEILKIIKEIYILIDKIARGHNLVNKYIIYHADGYRKTTKDTINWLTNILLDLQIKLNEHITTQQLLLQSAKSEVSEHIRGTTELGRVSELQRQRLDQQIEQFEELQRVLVRV